MADDTQEARIARAKQLRESIKKELGKTGGGERKPEQNSTPKTPRDAIHDRMRELDKKR
jgi:hypothetical protein